MPQAPLHTLSIEDATPESLLGLGRLVGVPEHAIGHGTSFYGNSVDLWQPGGFQSDEDTCLSVARVRPRTREVVWMERHFKHTQAFLPLNGQPFVVVMAPASPGNVPEKQSVRALRIPAGQGLQLDIGTWHEFPFPLENPVDMVVVLRNETNRNLDAVEDGEAIGEDLEKRNVQRRLGVTFSF